ncbi:Response regulator containing a CheY-like receiver domain and a GGDEF domain [Hahella chejuensis KCTC 2396]|uniref:Response regulator containing a CheY-like receiver domain and a GGDEF domain n=1 Tax=Hahella chejuensis (strain KCTC 2396) TaxID=349521 RepID=Q2SDF3_HAHCH|nr:response regulator [Hahella chejuensis]ABC31321.1 Response regulator containing a CheY-like receiver domain and a GGDEF domain [Hahella chejuensis KCTC 2396]
MPNLDLSILVVDDAKFSSAMIAKTLRNSGYHDVRIAHNAPSALQMLEERPVSVLIADWLMPEMDGLELTAKVRQLDEASNHFTYIILLTAKEGVEALAEAFDRGVDDFVYKSEMNKQLLPRVFAADRLSDMQNTLLVANQLLMDNIKELQERNVLDLATGLGNQVLARERLTDTLRQMESRGGAASYLLLGIKNWQTIKKHFNPAILEEIANGVSRRLRHLTRPLDTVCRISENQFAVIGQFSSLEQCTTSCYRRIHDGINLKAFKTTAGFVSVQAGTSVCAIDGSTTTPKAQQVEKVALRRLQYAYETATIALALWPEVSDEIKDSE